MASGEIAPRGEGRYRPIATLGEGGMARVLLTVSSGPAGVRKLLVVKQIRPELAHDTEFVAMFLDEARLAARLSHPNVIHTYEVGIDEAGPFIVMEYLDGQSMQALIAKVKRANIPLGVHLRILTKVLAGLHYAHELKDYNGTPLHVVHRDVSPQNVFIGYDGYVKVVDFGVAKVAGSAERTAAGTFKGKLGYIAPEQLSGDIVDRRADVFGVGVMLWEALAKRRLTANETAATVMHKRLQGMMPSVRELNPDLPDELVAICDMAMALEPDERFATAAEMQQALEVYLETARLRIDDREIGALVSQAFASERSNIRHVIEQQIGWVSEGRIKTALPHLGVNASIESLSPHGTGASSNPPTFASARPGSAPSNRNRRAVLVGGVALGFLALALVARWRVGYEGPHSPVIAPGARAIPEPIASAPAQPPDRPTVTLLIRVTPSKASLLLDGMPLPTNPFHSAVPKDSKVHKLAASAPGYASEERLLQYDEDAIVDLVLKRATLRGAAVSSAPVPGSDLKRAPRSKGTIDEEDPYQ
jgi:eukaryotic-like serine/threonine-protein kinase